MNMKFISFVFLVLAIFGCVSERELATFDTNINNKKSLESFVDKYDYVILETTDGSLISDVKDMKVTDNAICVLSDDKIFVFGKDGKFRSKIDRRGRGGEEYLSIDDFEPLDSLMFVLNRAQKTLIVYSAQGRFVRKIKLDDWYRHFKLVNADLAFLASENANDTHADFVLYDFKNEKRTKEFGYFTRNENVTYESFRPFAGTFDGGFYVIKPFDYTIYRLTETDMMPYQKYSFNTSVQLPPESENASFKDIKKKTMYKSVVNHLGLYAENGDTNFLTFELFDADHGGNGTNLCKTDEHKGTNYIVRLLEKFDADFPYISAPICIYDGNLVSVRSAGDILRTEKSHGLSRFTKMGLTNKSNPVVFFHKLKW